MNSLEKMIYEMKPIGIYDFSNSHSLILRELSSYSLPLQYLEDSVEKMMGELFLKTASGKGKGRFKCLYAADAYSDEKAEKYMEMSIFTPFAYWNRELWEYEISALPNPPVITDNAAAQSITIENFSVLPFEEQVKIIKLVRKYIACHLSLIALTGRRTWDESDAAELSFTQLEMLGITFDEIEIND